MLPISDAENTSITLNDYLTEQNIDTFYTGFAERLFLATEFMNSIYDLYTDVSNTKSSIDRPLIQKKLKLIPFLNVDNLTIKAHDVDDEALIQIRQFEVEIPLGICENSKALFDNYAYVDKELLNTKHIFAGVKASTNEEVYKSKFVNVVTPLSRILFYILFCCHPFLGKDYYSKIARTDQDERKFFLGDIRFIFDLEGNTNRFINGFHNRTWSLWKCLTEKQRLFWIETFNGRNTEYESFYSKWRDAYDGFYLTYSQAICGIKVPTIVYSNERHYIILSDFVVSSQKFRCDECIRNALNSCMNCLYPSDKRVIDILSMKLRLQSKSKASENEDSYDILMEKELLVYNGMYINESDFPNGKKDCPIFMTVASKKGDLLGLKLMADQPIVANCGTYKREYSKDGLIPLLPGTNISIFGIYTIIVPSV